MTHPLSASDLPQMFDLAPVSLWLEDYSTLRQQLQAWQDAGITNLREHLAANPAHRARCAQCIHIVQVNLHTLQLFGAPDLETLVQGLPRILRDDMHDRLVDEICTLWEGAAQFESQSANYTLDGRRLDIHIQGRILPGHAHDWRRVLLSLEDVTAREQALQTSRASERYAQQLFELSPVSLWVEDFSAVKTLMDELRHCGITDLATFLKVHPEFVTRCMAEIRVIDVNQQTLRMFGASTKAQLLNHLDRVFRDEMVDSFTEQLLDLWQGKLVQHREVVNYGLGGEPIHIHMQFAVLEQHTDRWDMVQVSLVDITARKKAEAYLEYLGKHDVLTGLRNRAYFNEELNRLARKGPWPVSMLVIDVNGLKAVNDDQGHAAGDALLRRAGEVLRKTVDPHVCAARIGGDEFVILLPGSDEHGAASTLERMQSLLELNNQFYTGERLSLSVGCVTCAAGQSLDQALQRGDRLMYEDKARYYRNQAQDRRTALKPGV